MKDKKKNWKGIKSLVSMKQRNNDTPSLIPKDEKHIYDPVSVANTFNNSFTSVAEIFHLKTQIFKKIIQELLFMRNQ